VESKLRKSLLFAPATAIEGWAHYSEQMMVEAGFGRTDPRVRLGQLAEALVRLARFIVGIRLHAEDMSVEAGMRFFRDEAFMEETGARREAERGTFDPTYLVYTLGKLEILKLREDYKKMKGDHYTLQGFHDAFLQQGFPPVKIVRKGELNKELLGLLLRNSRVPEWNRSDFNAILASLRLAERRVHEIVARFGVDHTIAAMAEMLDRNKRAMSAIIKMVVPEKKAYFEDYIDDDGVGMGPYRIACSLWREGDVAHFDFTGTDPQSISSVNFFLNEEMFKMFLGAFFINIFDPQILFNDGFYELVDVKIPAGSILKPQRPAALSCRTHLLGRIFDIMGGLLGQGSPDVLNAAGASLCFAVSPASFAGDLAFLFLSIGAEDA